jgi:hypothetical protein
MIKEAYSKQSLASTAVYDEKKTVFIKIGARRQSGVEPPDFRCLKALS